MGRKLKTWTLLVIILALIYVQQAPDIYAESADRDQKEEVEPPQDPETPQEPETPAEPIVSYQIEIPKEDGEHGWYKTRPEIKLRHMGSRGVTKYKVSAGGEVLKEGILEEKDEEVLLKKDLFRDGKSLLSVWMEDEDGKLVENNTLEKEIKVDTIAPQFEMTASAGFAVWYQKEAKLHVRGMDRESGIQEIACYVDGVYEGKKKAVEGEFVIQKPSAGGKSHTVTIIVKDQAGNQNSQIEELYIDQMAPRVKIGGAEAYMITSRPVTAVYEIEEENLLSEAIVETQWEDVEGKKTKMDASEWEETKSGKRGTQTLTEDGIYQIRIKAKDRAGYEAEDHRQIIIDKANPVIGYVDDLQGKYLKSFMWNYLKEELIRDFTTYTYGVKLDGNLYQMGKKIETEGRHLLEVQAVDAAGNEAVAKAEFVIDHTKPEIVFSNVEEGNEYEEKCVCKVELRNAEDAIQRVQINGEDQKIDAGSASFQCTLQVYQDYEVEVTAVDQAGNTAQESILFKVVPKKNIFQKIAEPVVQKLNKEEGKKQENMNDEEEKRKKDRWKEPMICLVILSCAVAAGGWYIRKGHRPE